MRIARNSPHFGAYKRQATHAKEASRCTMLTNLAVALLVLIGVHADTKPMVRYRYETEDLMQKAASSYPMHGYRVIESGYYPAGSAQFAGSGSGSGFSGQGFGQNRFFGGFGNIGNGTYNFKPNRNLFIIVM